MISLRHSPTRTASSLALRDGLDPSSLDKTSQLPERLRRYVEGVRNAPEVRSRLLADRDQHHVSLRAVPRPERADESTAHEDPPNAAFTQHDAALRVEPLRARAGFDQRQRHRGTLRHRTVRRPPLAKNSQLRPAPLPHTNHPFFPLVRVTGDQAARTLEHESEPVSRPRRRLRKHVFIAAL